MSFYVKEGSNIKAKYKATGGKLGIGGVGLKGTSYIGTTPIEDRQFPSYKLIRELKVHV